MSLEKLEWLLREDMNLNVLKVGVSERAERELLQEEWKTQRLETENQNLRQENKELKVSKNLLEDIQEVITEKEVSSLNKRLDVLREARMASKRGYEPKRSKGRSI